MSTSKPKPEGKDRGGKRPDMHVEESVQINRPVEEVFSYVTTLESQPE
jgi:uncharacterized membrane protein